MIPIMKKIIILLLFFPFTFTSCDKDYDDHESSLLGIFIETLPISGRTQIDFINSNRLIISEPGSPRNDDFFYSISDNTITLIPVGDTSSSSVLEFEFIDENKFIIENLHPSIPEDPTVYMTFEKQ